MRTYAWQRFTAYLATLNGWQRLWLVISTPFFFVWTVIMPVTELLSDSRGYHATADEAWVMFMMNGVGWPVFIYAVGWSIARIRRGFREK
jgi:hypothetical protein